jgi:2-methylisocitrate lyase-like PEP mutase family enzyme
VAGRLQAFADAGADELMLIVDPARPAAIEELARAVELTRIRPPAWAPGG